MPHSNLLEIARDAARSAVKVSACERMMDAIRTAQTNPNAINLLTTYTNSKVVSMLAPMGVRESVAAIALEAALDKAGADPSELTIDNAMLAADALGLLTAKVGMIEDELRGRLGQARPAWLMENGEARQA